MQKTRKKKYVLSIDLKDFFESITFPRIYGVLKNILLIWGDPQPRCWHNYVSITEKCHKVRRLHRFYQTLLRQHWIRL